jgi:hypothetical protein
MQNALPIIADQPGRAACRARAVTSRSSFIVRLTTTSGTEACIRSMTSLRAKEIGLTVPPHMSLVFPWRQLPAAPDKHEVAWSHFGSHQSGLYPITACYCVFSGRTGNCFA